MVSEEKCKRILGVSDDATAESVRQAYLDLARVWHPDRFQSDERLRKIAEDHLREINEAYAALKNYRQAESSQGPRRAHANAGSRSTTSRESATATETSPPARPEPGRSPEWTSWTPPASFRRPASRARARWWSISNKVAYTAVVTVLVVVPLVAVCQLSSLVGVPNLDINRISSQAFRPKILSPMRVIDSNSGVLEAADALTTWARGDAIDLWKPVRPNGSASAAPVTQVDTNVRKPSGTTSPRKTDHKRTAAITAYAPPPNGTDLMANEGLSGAGELRVSNHTGLDAVFKLVSGRRTRRAVYVASDGRVTLRSIPVGMYYLQADLGKNLDVEHLQFLSGRVTPAPLGPFQFLQVTSETGTAGNHYDVVLNPQ